MGLSAFEECSTPSPYCSPSIDRSLTTRLIESSNIPSKSSSCFAHTPEWADGLDSWSSSQICTTKTDIPRRHLDFHRDLGIYLPRHEKPNSAPISSKNLQINSKLPSNQFPPERIRQLIKREKDLLLQNDLSNSRVVTIDHQPVLPPVPTNTFRQSNPVEISATNEVRLPLHHITSKPLSPPPAPQHPPLNQDTLKTLLKEHLTSLLTRGASTINANRSLIKVPSVDIKQQIRTAPKLTDERVSKLDELIPTQQLKTNQMPPVIFYQRSTLGLTVTPMDLSSQRNTQSVSLEKMAQQRNFLPDSDSSSVASTSRPSTQPVPLPPPPPPTHLYQQQQRVVLRRNLDTATSSPGDLTISNEPSTNKLFEASQLSQNHRKGPSHHRSSSKNGVHRAAVPATTTTIELLPPIISGKRLHIPIANHRYL